MVDFLSPTSALIDSMIGKYCTGRKRTLPIRRHVSDLETCFLYRLGMAAMFTASFESEILVLVGVDVVCCMCRDSETRMKNITMGMLRVIIVNEDRHIVSFFVFVEGPYAFVTCRTDVPFPSYYLKIF